MANLKFQFLQRGRYIVQELADALKIKNQNDLVPLAQTLEQRDRDLEDYLNKLGAGGTAQSILAVYEGSHAFTWGPVGAFDNTQTFDINVPIPSNTAFNYYIDARLSTSFHITQPSDGFLKLGTWFEFVGFSNGAGFEGWGQTEDNNYLAANSPIDLSLTAKRIIQIPSANYGTTIPVRATALENGYPDSTGASGTGSLNAHALLIAIPV